MFLACVQTQFPNSNRCRCDTESQYARWMAALRLAAKGKTMADSGYDAEVKSIQAFLAMQHPASQPVINPNSIDINIEDYVAPRFLRKMKSKVQPVKKFTFLNLVISSHSSLLYILTLSELLQLHSSMSARSIGNGTEILILRFPSFPNTNKYGIRMQAIPMKLYKGFFEHL